MKKLVIVLILLVVTIPIALAEEVRYYYFGSNLIATNDNNGIKYFSNDRLGSNRITTDNNGNKLSNSKTLPFGEEVIDSNEKFTFTGKELDDNSNLYYFGARYLDYDIGRFISTDSVKSNQRYTYVNNNPLKFIDPDGADISYPNPVSIGGDTINRFIIYATDSDLGRIAGHVEYSMYESGGNNVISVQQIGVKKDIDGLEEGINYRGRGIGKGLYQKLIDSNPGVNEYSSPGLGSFDSVTDNALSIRKYGVPVSHTAFKEKGFTQLSRGSDWISVRGDDLINQYRKLGYEIAKPNFKWKIKHVKRTTLRFFSRFKGGGKLNALGMDPLGMIEVYNDPTGFKADIYSRSRADLYGGIALTNAGSAAGPGKIMGGLARPFLNYFNLISAELLSQKDSSVLSGYNDPEI